MVKIIKNNFFVLLLFHFSIILSCISIKPNNDLELIKKESYFNDFKVIDDKVYIECKIT